MRHRTHRPLPASATRLTTDADGSFTIDYYICGDNWSLREISPSEGYLLDSTVYEISAGSGNFTVELNQISEGVKEHVIKGCIRIVKHIDEKLDVGDAAETVEPADNGIVLLSAGMETAAESFADTVSGNDAEMTKMPSEETVDTLDSRTEETVSDGDAIVSDTEDILT